MTAPTVSTVSTVESTGTAPWLLTHATACAEAVATALDLLEDDEVETVADGADGAAGDGFTLRVHADPSPSVQALRWSPDGGWEATADPHRRQDPRWWALPVAADADPLALCEVLRGTR